jgi:hypothetical protein
MQLMEVMPTLLCKRSFKAPMCKRQLEAGYRDAPHPAHPMAIAFIKVRAAAPLLCTACEQTAAGRGRGAPRLLLQFACS